MKLSRYPPQIDQLTQKQLFYNVRTTTRCNGYAKSTTTQSTQLVFLLKHIQVFDNDSLDAFTINIY